MKKELNTLGGRELGLLSKIMSKFHFFSKFESAIRKELLKSCKLVVVN